VFLVQFVSPLPHFQLELTRQAFPGCDFLRSHAVTATTSSIFSGSPAYVARTPWRPAWALLATLLISVTGVLTLSGLLSLDNVLRGLGRVDGLWRKDTGTLLTLAAWQAVTIGLTVGASALFGGKISEVLALQAPAGGVRMYAVAAGLTVALLAALTVINAWVAPEASQNQPSTPLFGELWVLALLVVGVGGPISEELLFRGFLLSAFATTRIGFWGAAIISTVCWAVLHGSYSAAGFLSIFVMGLLFCWQLQRSGSLRVPIFCHALYNVLIVVVFGRVTVQS
jgi:membrane protease YdiL (CAAX protease family)